MRRSILISYLIGFPIGLLTIIIVFLIPAAVTGEGLATMAIGFIYGKAIIGLVISFFLALGLGGYIAFKNLVKRRSLLTTSFFYSLIINSIIWTVFIVITIFVNFEEGWFIYAIPPVVAFAVSTTTSTFTICLLICYVIKRGITKASNSNITQNL